MRAAIAGACAAGAIWLAACQSPEPVATGGASPAADAAREFWSAYKAAGERHAQGDCGPAIALYQQALALRPTHEDSLYYMGNCHAELGDRAQALAAYERLVAVNPEGSSRGYMQMGLLLASPDGDGRRDLEGAKQKFERALEVDSDSGALLGLAEVALLQRRWTEAARLLEAVGADNAMSIAAPYLQSYLAFRAGDRPAAWRLFQTAVERGALKKGLVAWSEEGDVKADPALRWRALARQSVLGDRWIGLGRYLAPPGPSIADMERELRALDAVVR